MQGGENLGNQNHMLHTGSHAKGDSYLVKDKRNGLVEIGSRKNEVQISSPNQKWIKKKRAHKDTSLSPFSQLGSTEKQAGGPSLGVGSGSLMNTAANKSKAGMT